MLGAFMQTSMRTRYVKDDVARGLQEPDLVEFPQGEMIHL